MRLVLGWSAAAEFCWDLAAVGCPGAGLGELAGMVPAGTSAQLAAACVPPGGSPRPTNTPAIGGRSFAARSPLACGFPAECASLPQPASASHAVPTSTLRAASTVRARSVLMPTCSTRLRSIASNAHNPSCRRQTRRGRDSSAVGRACGIKELTYRLTIMENSAAGK